MKKDKKIIEDSISELYNKDKWVRDFMQSTYDIFGMPISTDLCLNKTDKILFVWAMMSLVKAMKQDESWKELKKENLDPEEAAYKYAESHYELTGGFVLPSTINNENEEKDL